MANPSVVSLACAAFLPSLPPQEACTSDDSRPATFAPGTSLAASGRSDSSGNCISCSVAEPAVEVIFNAAVNLPA